MKHRNKLIERKRHAAAITTTALRRYLLIPTYFQTEVDMSEIMEEIGLDRRREMCISAAIKDAVEKYENPQKS